nr:hypothetical protein [Natronobiforma cellulositropha]
MSLFAALSLLSSTAPVPSFALLFDAFPWWIAAPLLQLGLLVAGMALDETYVNRTTVLAGAFALAVHAMVAGGTGFMVGIYLDVGLVIGAYGLYAYVVDAYVDNWFRVVAYFVYSPLAVFLVILLPDIAMPVALVVAGYANLQLMAYFAPNEPYYFGPETPEAFEAAVAAAGTEATDGPETDGSQPTEAAASAPEQTAYANDADAAAPSGTHPAAEPVGGGDSSERGILPEFMRRL